ncbi:YciI family protein [Ornithinimicrobium sp. INDO-MA30-4]|uniref:YciI family protein n=1 Tax=Ornithinimicrobium sp. INDO-MA30-4 TaxID=2908651 RepID=UPI001F424B62|nr:YciI family protein [Ornithinimicrobium sp. INDO-MA30-4]UJH70273.1 hypothetical protein L0A91_14115 [Ornithinimicrobium sp. INDO-MA30-4]
MTHIFAVNYVYADDASALDTNRPAHRQFLAGLAAEGALLLSGPLKASEPGALLIVRGEHAEGVRAQLKGDPFSAKVSSHTLRSTPGRPSSVPGCRPKAPDQPICTLKQSDRNVLFVSPTGRHGQLARSCLVGWSRGWWMRLVLSRYIRGMG